MFEVLGKNYNGLLSILLKFWPAMEILTLLWQILMLLGQFSMEVNNQSYTARTKQSHSVRENNRNEVVEVEVVAAAAVQTTRRTSKNRFK